MKCIVGLGIGKKLDGTRHNIGFEVVDELIDRHQLQLDKQNLKVPILSDQ